MPKSMIIIDALLAFNYIYEDARPMKREIEYAVRL